MAALGVALLWHSNQHRADPIEVAGEAAKLSAADAADLAQTTALLRTLLEASPIPIQAFAMDRTVLA